ncbi:hypothetical protein, partial [Legionella pneumophila]|uniref:hypothetical protein n=1 Tax=Legionella pneumophila TaxID=446 RepID=UPI001F4F5941
PSPTAGDEEPIWKYRTALGCISPRIPEIPFGRLIYRATSRTAYYVAEKRWCKCTALCYI